jgi:lipopolysaccharide transport system ATP-binding protein
MQSLTSTSLEKRIDRKGSGVLKFTQVDLRNSEDISTETVMSGEDITIALSFRIPDNKIKMNVSVGISFYGPSGEHLFTCWTMMLDSNYKTLDSSEIIRCHIKELPLAPGLYTFNLYCEVNGLMADWITHAASLNVIEGDFFGTGRLPPKSHGGLLVKHEWKKSR